MITTIIYIHGKGGSAEEAEHYKTLFPNACVVGLDYHAQIPWEACEEFAELLKQETKPQEMKLRETTETILVANSIGAFFALHSFGDQAIKKAYFISPIVNMEKLITDMMQWAGVTENDLAEKGTIETGFGETLSWEYLSWVRKHPVSWKIPTKILYGSNDNLQTIDTIREFAANTGAEVTIMENGEHWFHTEEQMRFLDGWIRKDE